MVLMREKIVAEFFKKGHLLTNDAIKTLEGGYEGFLNKDMPLVVDAKDLQQPYRIIKNLAHTKKEITSEDFIRFYNSKYEKMKEVILSRIPKDFLSLNKIDTSRSEVHVLGIVKEIKEKDGKKVVDMEDTTASIPIIFETADIDPDLELDDVIAVRGITGGKVLFGKKIIYPDIPLRQPSLGSGRACFVSDFRLDEASTKDAERFFEWLSQQDIPYLLVAGDLGDKELFEKYVDRYCYMKTVFVIASGGAYPQTPLEFRSRRIISLSNPAMIELGGIKILMVHKGDVKMLRKRYLGNSSVILDEDYLVLDEAPAIMHTGNGDEPYINNYKSTTIINSGSLLGIFRPIVIDFATRDAEKIAIP